jgi:putative hemolysin
LESTEGDTSFFPLLLEAGTTFSSSNATILIVIVLILLLLTAITAGAETAYFSLTAKDINFLKGHDKSSARTAGQLLDQPKRLLATILVANNFINIAIVITTDMLVKSLLPGSMNPVLTFLIQVVCVTFLLVLFGAILGPIPTGYVVDVSARKRLPGIIYTLH